MLLPVALGFLIAYLLFRLLGIGWQLVGVLPGFMPLFGVVGGAAASFFLIAIPAGLMGLPETFDVWISGIAVTAALLGALAGARAAGRCVQWAQRNHNHPASRIRRAARAVEFVSVTWPVLAFGAIGVVATVNEATFGEDVTTIDVALFPFLLALACWFLWCRYLDLAPRRRSAEAEPPGLG